MRIGDAVITLPTVKPKLYAGKVGTIAVRNEDEVGVLINGKIVWFVEKEIEECVNANRVQESSVRHMAGNGAVVTRRVSTQERAREGGYRGLCSMCGPVGANVCSSCRSCRHVCRGALGNPCAVLTNPPRAVPGSERPSEPRPPSAAPRGSGDLTGFNPGERGPGGGVVAKCVECKGLWERPKQRGRPSLKCEGCRG